MQITGDVFGIKVERPHTYETSGLSAALAAAVGSHLSFKTAVEEMTHAGDSFEPNSASHLMYDELYRNVDLKCTVACNRVTKRYGQSRGIRLNGTNYNYLSGTIGAGRSAKDSMLSATNSWGPTKRLLI
jgi:hypothetical protein